MHIPLFLFLVRLPISEATRSASETQPVACPSAAEIQSTRINHEPSASVLRHTPRRPSVLGIVHHPDPSHHIAHPLFLLSISHRLVRFRCPLVPSLWRPTRRRLHLERLAALPPLRLHVRSMRERLLEIADAARHVFVALHRERDHGLLYDSGG